MGGHGRVPELTLDGESLGDSTERVGRLPARLSRSPVPLGCPPSARPAGGTVPSVVDGVVGVRSLGHEASTGRLRTGLEGALWRGRRALSHVRRQMASGHASDRDAGDDRTVESMEITGGEHGGAHEEHATAHDRHGGPHTRPSWAGAVAQDPSPDMADWTEAERVVWGLGPFDGGVPGMVRRVRRILDVSQRGLAALLGVSQSMVARWETGRTSPRVAMLQRILGLARLAFTVHDEESGELVESMRDDGARTRGGSRFPAHTDIRATGWWLPRHLRTWTSIEAWACQRRSRAALVPLIRHRTSPHWKRIERFLLGTPDDHPALHQMVAEVQSLDDLREARRRAAGNGHPHPAA